MNTILSIYIYHDTVGFKNNRPPLFFQVLTHSCLLNNIGTLTFRIHLKIYWFVYEFVLFETQLNVAMLNIYLNVSCDNSCAICYLAPGGGCEVLFSPCLSVCLCVCLCVCLSVCVCVRPIFWYFISRLLEEILI